ncbi:MAG: HU family DNA-binding protein [Desulfovibrio sp.]|nr:HU family DNA-binding protein [Desulfovibrio sp.]
MTKSELINLLKEATQLAGVQAGEYLNRLGDIMAAELLAGGEVPLPGVGKLAVKQTNARKGRNPKTGAALDIPASRKVAVNLGKEFKESFK